MCRTRRLSMCAMFSVCRRIRALLNTPGDRVTPRVRVLDQLSQRLHPLVEIINLHVDERLESFYNKQHFETDLTLFFVLSTNTSQHPR